MSFPPKGIILVDLRGGCGLFWRGPWRCITATEGREGASTRGGTLCSSGPTWVPEFRHAQFRAIDVLPTGNTWRPVFKTLWCGWGISVAKKLSFQVFSVRRRGLRRLLLTHSGGCVTCGKICCGEKSLEHTPMWRLIRWLRGESWSPIMGVGHLVGCGCFSPADLYNFNLVWCPKGICFKSVKCCHIACERRPNEKSRLFFCLIFVLCSRGRNKMATVVGRFWYCCSLFYFLLFYHLTFLAMPALSTLCWWV